MAYNTSGTIGNTLIDTATVLDHAFRRVRVHPSKQTPETVQIARDNLYLLLLNLVNRGLNLWSVATEFVGLRDGQQAYESPPGTIDILNLVYCQPTQVTGTEVTTATSTTTTLDTATRVVRVGVKFSAVTASNTLTFSTSTDAGATWEAAYAVTKTDWAADTWYWFPLDVILTGDAYRCVGSAALTTSEFYLAGNVTELPVSQWNRDTWALTPNKSQTGRPSTNYYFEKLLTPRVQLWPIPNNNYDHLALFLHRQVQDVGTLQQQLDLPQRWLDAIIWQLAERLAFELPDVDPQLIPIISGKAATSMEEAEDEESDGAPLLLQPAISVYTR